MLVRFQVSNFLSIREPQELLLTATTSADGDRAVFERAKLNLLPVAAIYGANASGKTNFMGALSWMCHAIVSSTTAWEVGGGIPRTPFLLDTVSREEVSSFEVDFVVDEVLYHYGFDVDSSEVVAEWLHAFPHGRRQVWFSRNRDGTQFGKNMPGKNRSIEDLTRKNCLFLTSAADKNHELLLPIHQWFRHNVKFMAESRRESTMEFVTRRLQDPEARPRIVDMVRRADLGIVDAEVSDEPMDPKVVQLLRAWSEIMDLNARDLKEPRKLSIQLRHIAPGLEDGIAFPLEAESRGTRAWLDLCARVLFVLDGGSVLCVDELDTSLHPRLVMEIVDLFKNPDSNPNGAQLVFNTHDTNLIGTVFGEQILARDEVWFIEKGPGGASRLYPLTDYKPRKKSNLERGYLQGRFGAVPFVAEMREIRPRPLSMTRDE